MRGLLLDKILNKYKLQLFDITKPISTEIIEPLLEEITERYYDSNPTLPITNSFVIDRIYTIRKYQLSLEELKKVPRIEQRSQEWYKIRENLISASDFGNALNRGMMKDKSLNELYKKKVGYDVQEHSEKTKDIMGRGNMLEDIVAMLYEYKRKVKILDFGLIPYTKDPRFGASPDGVTEYGQCIEIKCPYMRKIDGKIPFYYYCQVQGQMEICGFEETDYIECDFYDYRDNSEFDLDYDEGEVYSKDIKDKGILIGYRELGSSDEIFENKYCYSPIGLNKKDLYKWRDEQLIKLQNTENIRLETIDVRYWKLNNILIQRLYRDQEFITEMMKELDYVHNQIQKYKENKILYDLEVKKNGRIVKRVKQEAPNNLITPVFQPVYKEPIKDDNIILEAGICGVMNDGTYEPLNDKLAIECLHESDLIIPPHRYGSDNMKYKKEKKEEEDKNRIVLNTDINFSQIREISSISSKNNETSNNKQKVKGFLFSDI